MAHTLQPGTYRLTREVKNPKPRNSRRYRQWTSAKVIPEGSMFAVALSPTGPGWDDPVLVLRCHGHTDYGDEALENDKDGIFAAIAPLLSPVSEAPSDLLIRQEWTLMGAGILDQLALAGLITTEQVEAAALAFLEAERQKARS